MRSISDVQLAKQKEAEARKKQKELEQAKKKMDAQLFATAQVQKVPFGTGELGEREAQLIFQIPKLCSASSSRLDTVPRVSGGRFSAWLTCREQVQVLA